MVTPIRKNNPNWQKNSAPENIADATSVVLGINKKKVTVKKGKIKDIAAGLAEVAYSMGETNDPEEYAEEMAEDILEALKDAEGKRIKKAKRKQ